MTDIDIDRLTQDLRSRINPAYADTVGTESWERKICADALQEQQIEIQRLRAELAIARQALSELGVTPEEARAGVARSRAKTAEIERLQAELRDSNERIAYLQNELRSYKEREKVWGWNSRNARSSTETRREGMSKHTSGPWVVVERDHSLCVQTESPDRTKFGASRYAAIGGFDRGNPKQLEEARANARPIAAAPELLDALADLLAALQ